MVYRSLCVAALAAVSVFALAGEKLVKVAGSPDATKFQHSQKPLDHSQRLHLALSFKNVDSEGAAAFVASLSDPNSPNFQKFIDPVQFGYLYGARQADIDSVTGYLSSHGFENVRVSDNRLFVFADATMGRAESAFHTKLGHFQRPAEISKPGDPDTFYAPASDPVLPESIGGRINGVHGLSNILIQRPLGGKLLRAGLGQGSNPQISYSYTPAQLSKAYGTDLIHNWGTKGQGMKIAVYSPTKRYAGDIGTFASHYAITGYTVTDIKVGTTGPTSLNGAPEASLDIETIIGQAPNATVDVFEPDGSPQGELDTFNLVASMKGIPVISSSWGYEEHDVILAGAQVFATDFANVCSADSSAGISIFVASGDSGVYSRNTTSIVTTQMESSCPYVTAVGGTSLYLNSDSSYNHETDWTWSSGTNSGGGGGLSQLFARPSWQAGPGVINSHSNGKRQVPDVAADADPYTGYDTVVNGSWAVYGGTSAATPLWASNTLLLIQRYRLVTGISTKSLGNLSPALYWLGVRFENPASDFAGVFYMFHDITSGFNGIESCTPAWDYCDGWGSVSFYKLTLDLGNYLAILAYEPDYEPYNPHSSIAAWTMPVMIHTSTTTVAEPTSFSHSSTLYFAACIANIGKSDAQITQTALKIDGVVKKIYDFPALPVSWYAYSNNIYSTTLAAGSHTIQLVVNNGGGARESNTSNDTFTRTIVVH